MTTFSLNAVYGQPGVPLVGSCAAPCSAVDGGNGLGAIATGAPLLSITALSALMAYRVCAMGVGGIRYASNLLPGDQNAGLFLTLAPSGVGALTPVTMSGPVVNVISGIGGWAWTIGMPVYLSQNGELTQTIPVVGFVRAVGLALSGNTIAFFPQAQYGAFAQSPRVVIAAYAPTMTLDPTTLDIADITLVGNTTVSIGAGYDGQQVTVRVNQDAIGSWTIAFGASVTLNGFTMSSGALSTKLLRLSYYAAISKWIQV